MFVSFELLHWSWSQEVDFHPNCSKESHYRSPSRVLQLFSKPTMVVNSQDMRTIMLGAGWCWKISSLTSSSKDWRTYDRNVKWSEARRDIQNRMEVSKGLIRQCRRSWVGGWRPTKQPTGQLAARYVSGQWRINTQVHQTLKDTPYHLTYGTHPQVGISNLPVSEDVLAKLVTDGELQDVYQQLGSSIVDKDASETIAIAGTEVAGSSFECGTADSPNASLPTSSLGKRKNKSPSETSSFTRGMRGAKNIALANAVLLSETRAVLPVNPPVNITSPSKGTGKTTGDTPPYVY